MANTHRHFCILVLAFLTTCAVLMIVQNVLGLRTLLYPSFDPINLYKTERDKGVTEVSRCLPPICGSEEEATAAKSLEPSVAQRLKKILKCADQKLIAEKRQYGNFWVVRNFLRGSKSVDMGCAESVTYTTIGDYTFCAHLPVLIKRWLAPISFALFTPGYDLLAALDSIQYLRNCLPESELIRQYITFHVFFPADHMPPHLPLTESEIIAWPFNCTQPPPYEDVDRQEMYKTKNNLTYPINVARNIARKAVNTYFILASDVEMFPSLGLVDKFLEMVANDPNVIFGGDKPRVFPLAVFELQENTTLPNTKTELVQMLHTKQALPFHSKVCQNCHLVPQQAEWVNASDSDELSVFTVGKRKGKFAYWEPFYISDNREPIFDERVTWEGQKNKRIQNFAMCLLDYEYHVLHPAFLVHSPGIKYKENFKNRSMYVDAMNKLIKSKIEPEYKILFGNTKGCYT